MTQSLPSIQSVRGPFFYYPLPQGWIVGEQGNFAFTMNAPNRSAAVWNSGMSGWMYPLTPEVFATEKFVDMCRCVGITVSNLSVLGSGSIQPLPGYTHAAAMELVCTLTGNGTMNMRAAVFSHVANTYNRSDACFTIGFANADMWDSYISWLPAIAAQVVNIGPNPYGRTGMSMAISEIGIRDNLAFQDYLRWSQQNWAGVQADRDASFNFQHSQNDPTLTGQQWYTNPYGYPAQRLASGITHWMNRDGRVQSSYDPSFDPNTPLDPNWTRMTSQD